MVKRPRGSFEHAEDVAFERLSILPPFHTRLQLLSHDDAGILERCERVMESLKSFVGGRLEERVDEELCRARTSASLESRLDHGERDVDAKHDPCAVNELALKHGEVERAFDGLSLDT
jgi:hypothetical protein